MSDMVRECIYTMQAFCPAMHHAAMQVSNPVCYPANLGRIQPSLQRDWPGYKHSPLLHVHLVTFLAGQPPKGIGDERSSLLKDSENGTQGGCIYGIADVRTDRWWVNLEKIQNTCVIFFAFTTFDVNAAPCVY